MTFENLNLAFFSLLMIGLLIITGLIRRSSGKIFSDDNFNPIFVVTLFSRRNLQSMKLKAILRFFALVMLSFSISGLKTGTTVKPVERKGVDIIFSIEKTPLGTGGAIKKALVNVKDESFLVLNGDIVTNIDLRKILKKPNTIASNELKTKFGTMNIKNNKILKFNEKMDVTNVWMNPGIYHLSRNIEKMIPKKGSLEEIVFPKMAKNKMLNTIKFKNALWFSIDSHKDIEECSKEIKLKKHSKYFKY